MASRTQSNRILFECTVFLFALMFAVLGKIGHQHWLIIVAAIVWLGASAGLPNAFGDGLNLGFALFVGAVVAIVSFFGGAIFLTWTGAFVLAVLSVVVIFIATRMTN